MISKGGQMRIRVQAVWWVDGIFKTVLGLGRWPPNPTYVNAWSMLAEILEPTLI